MIIIRMKSYKKQMKMQKLPMAVLLAVCLLSLTSCGIDIGQNDGQPTVKVSEMTAPVEMAAPAAREPQKPALYCRIGQGEALFGRAWHNFQSAAFALRQGESLDVSIFRRRGTETITIQAFFDDGGQKFVFCPRVAGDPDRNILCASLYTLQEDLQLGIKRTFDIPNAIRGGEISCAYDTSNLKPLAAP